MVLIVSCLPYVSLWFLSVAERKLPHSSEASPCCLPPVHVQLFSNRFQNVCPGQHLALCINAVLVLLYCKDVGNFQLFPSHYSYTHGADVYVCENYVV